MATRAVDDDVLVAVCNGSLTEPQARQFARQSSEIIAFTLLAVAARVAAPGHGRGDDARGPHTPSGSVPPYAKPETSAAGSRRRRGKPGARPGHAGHHRPRPVEIDQHRSHKLPCCPDCGGRLDRTGDTRTRVTEDIPEDLRPQVTEHTIHRDWCPKCRRRVEPRLPDVLPHCQVGNRVLVLSALLHFLNGCTLSQITSVFNFHLRLKITEGGLVQMWHRLAELLWDWYDQIHQSCLDAAVLHADETGWRVRGQTHWLWCFGTRDATYYMIERSRGHPALDKFFIEEFSGTLVTDFWAAYDAVGCAAHQRCWPHLLRELKAVDESGAGDDWPSFARRLRRVYGDAIKLSTQHGRMPLEDYEVAIARLEGRLIELAVTDWTQADARRLASRLYKYDGQLLTFLWNESVPSDNNHAERSIRPAVLIRKNSYANQSDRGALTQAVLMSVFRTLKQRGLNPIDTILKALTCYATTGKLPALPIKSLPSN